MSTVFLTQLAGTVCFVQLSLETGPCGGIDPLDTKRLGLLPGRNLADFSAQHLANLPLARV